MKSILRGQIKLTLAFLLILLVGGCGLKNIAPEDVPLAAYTGTRASFNWYVETYIEYRETIEEPEDLARLRAKFEPRFREARAALDVWGNLVRDDGDPAEAIDAYNKLLTTLLLELRKSGIIKIKKEGS